jgi:FkbM family methyltransferase
MSIKTSQINSNYLSVMQKAKASRQGDPRHGIEELLQMPTVSGFVDVAFLKDITVSMFLSQNDDGIALRCLWNGRFEPMSMALWAALSHESEAIFDVGAHSGIYSLVAQAANSKASVVSLEPLPVNFARLCLNLRVNEFSADQSLNMAASNGEGFVVFSVSTPPWYLSTGGSIVIDADPGGLFIKCTTLDAVSEAGKIMPDLLKIDVEGHELQVLEGCQRILKEQSPDLIIESVFNQNTDAIEQLLSAKGYLFYVISDDTLSVDRVDHLRPTSTDTVNMDKLNRLVTKRSAAEVSTLISRARSLLPSVLPST